MTRSLQPTSADPYVRPAARRRGARVGAALAGLVAALTPAVAADDGGGARPVLATVLPAPIARGELASDTTASAAADRAAGPSAAVASAFDDVPLPVDPGHGAAPAATQPVPGNLLGPATRPAGRSEILRPVEIWQDPPPLAKPPVPWAERLKHPTEWLTLGGDFRYRHEYADNVNLTAADPPGPVRSYERFRTRAWAKAAPTDWVDLNVRLTWEGRYYEEPDTKQGWDAAEVIWDNLNLRFGLPNNAGAVRIGRQDIKLGDGWLVVEGTPLDGSRSTYFDAVRATLNVRKATTLDLIYLEQRADPDAWLRPFSSDEVRPFEQDERGVIAYASDTSIAGTTLDGYFIWKHDAAVTAAGDSGDVYTVGGRVVRQVDAHWQAKAEAAYQFGERRNATLFPNSDGDLSAVGANARLTYAFKDPMKNEVWVGGEYLSGDDPNTKRNEQFDPLWNRWPGYSDLYWFVSGADARTGEQSNLYRANVGWQFCPISGMTASLNYHALFAAENPRAGRAGFSDDGYFRGHLMTGVLRHQFNPNVSGMFQLEYFVPGNYYAEGPGPLAARNDPVLFARVELVFSF